MAVLKEPITARPTSQHRHSSSIAHSLPKNRPHSHSMSFGSIHPHRITRRKSMSSTAAQQQLHQLDPIAAAEKGIVGAPLDGNTASRRPSKAAAAYRGPAMHSPAMASSVPNAGSAFGPSSYNHRQADNNHAVTDGPSLATMHEADKSAQAKSRIRRASEGTRQAKVDGKRTSGSELKCEQCGKGYKHSSCLTKHLWEHTPHWNITSKLLISKHQQVQLLEAASVLVGMHQDAESAVESDNSPSPPPASGDSDLRDGLSSTNTTPPPHMDDPYARPPFDKRYSTNSSSAFSQSYQSTIFSDNGQVGHYRQWSNASDRPTTSGTSYGSYQEDDQSLAAAVHLLSCSNGTPKSGPAALPADVPPVPPLPAKFMGFNTHETLSGSQMVTPQQSSLRSSGQGYQYNRKLSQDDSMQVDDDDDDGVFGRMEE